MKILAILFGLFILFSCTETKVSKESKSYTPDQCIMQSIRDSTISSQDQIIGYQFLCGGKDTIDTFLFFEENPWRAMGFPIDNDTTSIKQGFISFDLTKSTFQNLKDKFSITKNLQSKSLIPVTAWSECRYKYYNADVLLVNYILSINGVTDTLTLANRQMIHTESQLKVFLSNGETAYSLISKEFARTGAILDTTNRFLFLRTLKPHPFDGITGIEIRDIQRDSILFQLEMDSSFLVVDPKLYDQYAMYEIYTYISANEEEGIRPYQILVYDTSKRKMIKRNYDKDFTYTFEKISNEYLIYRYHEGDDIRTRYDTFKIADMEVISSSTQILQNR